MVRLRDNALNRVETAPARVALRLQGHFEGSSDRSDGEQFVGQLGSPIAEELATHASDKPSPACVASVVALGLPDPPSDDLHHIDTTGATVSKHARDSCSAAQRRSGHERD